MVRIAIIVILLSGCACESGIGIIGDTDTDDELADTAALTDTSSDSSAGSWDPSIENMGEPGWRDSTAPLCADLSEVVFAFDVWSSAEAVYVIAADNINTGMTYEDVNHIYKNEGSGWSLAYEDPASAVDPMRINSCFHQIMGVSGGPLYTWQGPSSPCELAVIQDGTIESTDFTAIEVFAVHADLVYVCSNVGLMHWDGDYWVRDSMEGCPYYAHLWADEQSVFVATENGIIHEFVDGDWVLHDSGSYHVLKSIWGFARNDLWVGGGDGRLMHFDGETWLRVDWPIMDSGSLEIIDMWGDEGVLFFVTSYQLTMWDGESFTVLAYWRDEGIRISAIWGNSPAELFLAVTDQNHSSEDCGREFLLWFDGTEFHWF